MEYRLRKPQVARVITNLFLSHNGAFTRSKKKKKNQRGGRFSWGEKIKGDGIEIIGSKELKARQTRMEESGYC